MVVFLDIDGVLNSEEYFLSSRYDDRTDEYPFSHIDPDAVDRINRLCNSLNAVIVLSSSWRHFTDKTINVLRSNGLIIPIIGITPSLDKQTDSGLYLATIRGNEIQKWIDDNFCKKYLIIDDDSDMLPKQKSRFIKTDRMFGFTEENLKESIEKCKLSNNV